MQDGVGEYYPLEDGVPYIGVETLRNVVREAEKGYIWGGSSSTIIRLSSKSIGRRKRSSYLIPRETVKLNIILLRWRFLYTFASGFLSR